MLFRQVRHLLAKDQFLEPVEICLKQDDSSQFVKVGGSELFL